MAPDDQSPPGTEWLALFAGLAFGLIFGGLAASLLCP